MFKRKKNEGRTSSVIGRETEFKGSLIDRGSLRIDGKFTGEIRTEGSLVLGEDAIVQANIKARSVFIGGKVIGNIDCEERVELSSTGSLEGKVKASDLTIAEGGFFNGECKMTPTDHRTVLEKDTFSEEAEEE